jgi:hypothetical protein
MLKMNQSSQKKKVGNRKAGSRKGGERSLTHPPQMNLYQLNWNKVLRFTSTAAAVGTQITFQNILNTILFASTATAPYQVFDYLRILRISVWGQAALGTPSTVQVIFNGTTIVGDANIHSDTSLGVLPACVHARPGATVAALFQLSGNAFQITCPAGSIIDVEVVMRDSLGLATSAANASVGATVGGVFYRGLDGLAAASTNFPPVGNVPTF